MGQSNSSDEYELTLVPHKVRVIDEHDDYVIIALYLIDPSDCFIHRRLSRSNPCYRELISNQDGKYYNITVNPKHIVTAKESDFTAQVPVSSITVLGDSYLKCYEEKNMREWYVPSSFDVKAGRTYQFKYSYDNKGRRIVSE